MTSLGIGRPSAWTLVLRDLKDGLLGIHVWPTMAWYEIRQRYRRSALGPFWLTISTGVLVAAMGPLYGRLFGQEVSSYFPFLAVGFIVWQLIAALMNDGGQVFIAAEAYIKQVRMPFTVHVLRMVCRNAIIFVHHLVIVVLIFIAYPVHLGWPVLLVIPGLALLFANGVWLGLMLGMLCARFRDIPPIVQSVVQVAFFITPIMWKREMLGEHAWAADANPLYHLIEVVRAPLLGQMPATVSWLAAIGLTIVGFALTLPVFARYRARIAYWL
jgi:ABC-type polysaccharide/polyol phosphate export permease